MFCYVILCYVLLLLCCVLLCFVIVVLCFVILVLCFVIVMFCNRHFVNIDRDIEALNCGHDHETIRQFYRYMYTVI